MEQIKHVELIKHKGVSGLEKINWTIYADSNFCSSSWRWRVISFSSYVLTCLSGNKAQRIQTKREKSYVRDAVMEGKT